MKYLVVYFSQMSSQMSISNGFYEAERLDETAVRRMVEGLKKEGGVIINVIPLDEPIAAEALMRGDCTACGAYQPDGPYPYQCELQGKISEGGCELWHPKGVLENDTD